MTPRREPQHPAASSGAAVTPADERSVEERIAILVREAPESDPVVARLTVLLHRASRVLSRIYRQALADSGISYPDYQVLRALVYSGPPYTLHPAEIARQCGQTKSTMTHRLDLLEQRDLLRRTSDPSHRARVLVEITRAGLETWRSAQHDSAHAEEHALATLAEREKLQLTELLSAVLAHTEH